MRTTTTLFACAALLGCNGEAKSEAFVQRAQFGIFFGGQLQEREQIPFELDQSKQTHGIRIEFREPPRRAVTVNWELDMPGTTRGVRDKQGRIGRGRLAKLGDATVRPGQKQFDQVLKFQPGDPLGLWNVRVVVDREVVIDRAFQVFDARARRRRLEDAGL